MNSAEKKRWRVVLAGPAQKSLERMPPRDQARVRAALDEMETHPFSGDIKYLKGDPRLRRRVGSWRIFFRAERAESVIYISAIERRSSATY
jgi:mRNA-degrading endonuclease RelE of RelBE toxin-antitoxin system